MEIMKRLEDSPVEPGSEPDPGAEPDGDGPGPYIDPNGAPVVS